MAQGAASVSPELSDCIQGLRSALSEHVRLLDGLIAILVQHESAASLRSETEEVPGELTSALAPMFQAAGSSSSTLISLSDGPRLRGFSRITPARA